MYLYTYLFGSVQLDAQSIHIGNSEIPVSENLATSYFKY
jgi:hypothetical protein